jgi:hypothetical protein
VTVANAVEVLPERASASLVDALDLINAEIGQVAGEPDGRDVSLRLATLMRRKADLICKLERVQAQEAKADELAARRGLLAGADEAVLREEVKSGIREFLRDWDISYALSTDCWWLYDPTKGSWTPLKEHALRMIDPARMRDAQYFILFDEVLREDGRWFRDITASFGPLPAHVLNLIRPDFCSLQDGDHHWVFDVLMRSLGGGKVENVGHIERLVLAKWQNPAGFLLPALAFHDVEGGSGKTLFVSTILRAVFGFSLVADNLSMRDVTGQFTSHTVGKAVWFVNESVEDRVDENALKRVLGSATLWIEPKVSGVGAFGTEVGC